ncbi:hypothetical protein Tco_0727875 [Tanacetum coccineum]|uniref:Reverse transcriptase Ty1/copia-type domain-containing protein n=1 Tax=Tanacetum coccineum TaxID=301880 RepID=A0ABQ4YJJ0_9ASTR
MTSSLGLLRRLQVKQKDDGIFISQDKYVANILKRFNFSSVKTAGTPLETNKALVKDKEVEDVDVHLYRSMIGSLMYLTASRPDIMLAICACASQDKYVAEILKKFDFASVKTASTPMETNKALVKDEEAKDMDVHLYRLLIGSLMYLTTSRPDIMFVVCACASDYAGASLDRKSTTEGCQFLGKRLISWQCKKQTIVTNSTTEAEYVVAANYCSGPRCQDTILGDVDAQTRKEAEIAHDETEHEESVPTPSNDPLLSGEDSMQLNDLIVLCTKLQKQVLDLEKAKSDQAIEIASLKKRVDMLEKRRKFRTTWLKRLKKVAAARRIEYSNDSLGAQEDASKQGTRIEDINADAEVTLVNETQERQDEDLMFDTRVLDDDEVCVDVTTIKKEEQSTKTGEAVTTAGVEDSVAPTIPITASVEDSVAPTIQVSTADIGDEGVTAAKIDELNLAQTLIEIKAAKPKVVIIAATTTTTTRPKARGVVVQELSEFKTSPEAQPSKSKNKGKAIMIEPEVPLKRKEQVALDEDLARNIQA